eukprot:12085440-Alexandrium_andersonii.AAC.1
MDGGFSAQQHKSLRLGAVAHRLARVGRRLRGGPPLPTGEVGNTWRVADMHQLKQNNAETA